MHLSHFKVCNDHCIDQLCFSSFRSLIVLTQFSWSFALHDLKWAAVDGWGDGDSCKKQMADWQMNKLEQQESLTLFLWRIDFSPQQSVFEVIFWTIQVCVQPPILHPGTRDMGSNFSFFRTFKSWKNSFKSHFYTLHFAHLFWWNTWTCATLIFHLVF